MLGKRDSTRDAWDQLEHAAAAFEQLQLNLLRQVLAVVVADLADAAPAPSKIFADDLTEAVLRLAEPRGNLRDVAGAALLIALERVIGDGKWLPQIPLDFVHETVRDAAGKPLRISSVSIGARSSPRTTTN